MIQRRTKIVATLGPASSSPDVLEKMIIAGLDVARLNFSHGSPDEHRARAELVREIAARHGRFVALLGDLQGPKIRIAKFTDKRIELKEGDQFRFSVTHPRDAGTQEVVARRRHPGSGWYRLPGFGQGLRCWRRAAAGRWARGNARGQRHGR